MATLLIPIDKIKEYSYIDTNVDDKVVKIAIQHAQVTVIEPLIGSNLYSKLLAGVTEGNLDLAYQNLIVQYIWPVLVASTELLILRRLIFRLTNSSIVKDTNTNAAPIEKDELDSLRAEVNELLTAHIKKLQLYLDSSTEFPEYTQANADELPSSPISDSILFYSDEVNYTVGPSNYYLK